MDFRALGSSGVRVSAIGLGCNNLGHIPESATEAILAKAIDLGVNLFDTANVYADGRSEEAIGRYLASDRHSIYIATKFGRPSSSTDRPTSRKNVFAAAEASLKRLRTDYIDIYQIHFPDSKTPIDETLRAMDDLVKQGKIRLLGCANFSRDQMIEAVAASCATGGAAALSTCQGEYNLMAQHASKELLPAVRDLGLGFLPSFPLASGLLTGKYSRHSAPDVSLRSRVVSGFADRFFLESNWRKLEIIERFCDTQDLSMVSVALSWLLSQPVVSSIIAGASSAQQLDDNIRAAASASATANRLGGLVSALDEQVNRDNQALNATGPAITKA